MKITSYSKQDLDAQAIITSFVDLSGRFTKILFALNQLMSTPLYESLATDIGSMSSKLSTKQLTILLDSVKEYRSTLMGINSGYKTINNSLTRAFNKTANLNTAKFIPTILRVRRYSNLIPDQVSAASVLDNIDSAEGQQIISELKDLETSCWDSLKQMNKIIDKLGFDRKKSLYKHLPENESELAIYGH